MAGSLVRPMRVRTKCDVYTCNNMADYEIGHGLMPVIAYHLCNDCMMTVFEEARELIRDKIAKENPSSIEENISENEEISENTSDTTIENANVSEENTKEVYVCKICGETFKKPSELSKYRSHFRRCQNANS